MRFFEPSLVAVLSVASCVGCSDTQFSSERSPTAPTTGTPVPFCAVIFAENRTQMISQARLEVIEGPMTGTVSEFDPSSGRYALAAVPGGEVKVSASADGFIPITATVPVVCAYNRPTEFVLQRRVPLADATHRLGGTMYAYPYKPGDLPYAAYPYVKVEILDGPLAGIFTFSDEALGEYYFEGLPPGRIQVRTFADWLEPQTVEVVVSGYTHLDFVMKPR